MKLVKFYLKQLIVSVLASLGYFTAGCVRAWSSPSVPNLNHVGNEYAMPQAPLSSEMLSWISSLAPLGALMGGLASSLALQYFGSRKTVFLAVFFYVLGFILIGSSYFLGIIETILVSRVCMGFAVGLDMPASQLYVI